MNFIVETIDFDSEGCQDTEVKVSYTATLLGRNIYYLDVSSPEKEQNDQINASYVAGEREEELIKGEIVIDRAIYNSGKMQDFERLIKDSIKTSMD